MTANEKHTEEEEEEEDGKPLSTFRKAEKEKDEYLLFIEQRMLKERKWQNGRILEHKKKERETLQGEPHQKDNEMEGKKKDDRMLRKRKAEEQIFDFEKKSEGGQKVRMQDQRKEENKDSLLENLSLNEHSKAFLSAADQEHKGEVLQEARETERKRRMKSEFEAERRKEQERISAREDEERNQTREQVKQHANKKEINTREDIKESEKREFERETGECQQQQEKKAEDENGEWGRVVQQKKKEESQRTVKSKVEGKRRQEQERTKLDGMEQLQKKDQEKEVEAEEELKINAQVNKGRKEWERFLKKQSPEERNYRDLAQRNQTEVIEITLDENCGEVGTKNERMEEKRKNGGKEWKIDERRRKEEKARWEQMEQQLEGKKEDKRKMRLKCEGVKGDRKRDEETRKWVRLTKQQMQDKEEDKMFRAQAEDDMTVDWEQFLELENHMQERQYDELIQPDIDTSFGTNCSYVDLLNFEPTTSTSTTNQEITEVSCCSQDYIFQFHCIFWFVFNCSRIQQYNLLLVPFRYAGDAPYLTR